MNDLISRQASIDALNDGAEFLRRALDCTDIVRAEREKYRWGLGLTESYISDIKELPPAQPDRPFEIQDILDYLDTVLHPIISPEHWNVYSELHDMISTLPSAQQWIPCSERLPSEPFGCIVTVWDSTPTGEGDDFENILPYFVGWDGEQWNDGDGKQCPFEVIAWMQLPEPYKGDDA